MGAVDQDKLRRRYHDVGTLGDEDWAALAIEDGICEVLPS